MLNTQFLINENKKNFNTSKKTNFKNFKKIIWNHGLYYPTPINLSYFWSFGSLATLAIVIQLITGIFLAMYYVPKDAYAFYSVENIMREVNFGWLIRYLHSNGASFFFIVVYLHIGRGLYYRSYEGRLQLWWTGLLLFLLMMATAFMGYVLPWGQMSFWGTMVITNLFSAVPVFGATLVTWLWGDFSVTDVTLNRFFSLHYLLALTIAAIIISHIIVLHDVGSSSPVYAECAPHFTKLKFQPFFVTKDIIGIIYFFIFLLYFIVLAPNYLGHSDNYIEANPFTTPEHIVPEWYFLPFYATLRSIPNKLQGIICMVLVIFSIGLLPLIDRTRIVNINTKPIYNITFWLWVASFIFLGWLGAKPLEEPYITLHQPAVFIYFSFYLLNWLVIQIIEQEILDYKKENVET